jgi:hypothetical protein
MKVTTETFDGSAEEYLQYLAAKRQSVATNTVPAVATVHTSGIADDERATTSALDQFVRSVLHRIAIPEGQRDLFRALCAAGDVGLFRNDLAERMNRTDAVLSGVLGALGRRIHQTQGSEEVAKQLGLNEYGISIFMLVRSLDGRWHYSLRPGVRRILEDEGLT